MTFRTCAAISILCEVACTIVFEVVGLVGIRFVHRDGFDAPRGGFSKGKERESSLDEDITRVSKELYTRCVVIPCCRGLLQLGALNLMCLRLSRIGSVSAVGATR